jgi:ribosome-associated heat shock protein Hsp15
MSDRASADRGVRLDKWLWAARFFKTRSLAVEAIEAARVKVNGSRVKRAKLIQSGDELQIRQGPYEHIVQVRALSERRGPAKDAAALYEETPASVTARERVAFQLKMAHHLFIPDAQARPTKRDRRRLEQFRKKGGWGE